MRPRELLCALVAMTVAGGCSDSVHAPWRIRFPPDGSLACSAGLELWINSNGCESPTELYREGFEVGARPRVLETLPPGRYGFGARAHDASGNWFAEGCTVVTLPHSDGTPIVVTLMRTGAPLDCTIPDGGRDAGGMLDGGPRLDAGPGMDGGSAPDAGVDAGVDSGCGVSGGDPCATDEAHSACVVGCNGPVRGPAANDQFGGYCLIGGPSGTCADTNDDCVEMFPMGEGLCLQPCPVAATYSSTGGCPSGSRCYAWDASNGYCFPDCQVNADCTTGMCFADGSC